MHCKSFEIQFFVSHPAKFCDNFCFNQMSNAKILQSEFTAESNYKRKLKLNHLKKHKKSNIIKFHCQCHKSEKKNNYIGLKPETQAIKENFSQIN